MGLAFARSPRAAHQESTATSTSAVPRKISIQSKTGCRWRQRRWPMRPRFTDCADNRALAVAIAGDYLAMERHS